MARRYTSFHHWRLRAMPGEVLIHAVAPGHARRGVHRQKYQTPIASNAPSNTICTTA